MWPKISDDRIRDLGEAMADHIWNRYPDIFSFEVLDVTQEEYILSRRYAAWLLREKRRLFRAPKLKLKSVK